MYPAQATQLRSRKFSSFGMILLIAAINIERSMAATKRQITIGQYFFPHTASFSNYGWNSDAHSQVEPVYDEVILSPHEEQEESRNLFISDLEPASGISGFANDQKAISGHQSFEDTHMRRANTSAYHHEDSKIRNYPIPVRVLHGNRFGIARNMANILSAGSLSQYQSHVPKKPHINLANDLRMISDGDMITDVRIHMSVHGTENTSDTNDRNSIEGRSFENMLDENEFASSNSEGDRNMRRANSTTGIAQQAVVEVAENAIGGKVVIDLTNEASKIKVLPQLSRPPIIPARGHQSSEITRGIVAARDDNLRSRTEIFNQLLKVRTEVLGLRRDIREMKHLLIHRMRLNAGEQASSSDRNSNRMRSVSTVAAGQSKFIEQQQNDTFEQSVKPGQKLEQTHRKPQLKSQQFTQQPTSSRSFVIFASQTTSIAPSALLKQRLKVNVHAPAFHRKYTSVAPADIRLWTPAKKSRVTAAHRRFNKTEIKKTDSSWLLIGQLPDDGHAMSISEQSALINNSATHKIEINQSNLNGMVQLGSMVRISNDTTNLPSDRTRLLFGHKTMVSDDRKPSNGRTSNTSKNKLKSPEHSHNHDQRPSSFNSNEVHQSKINQPINGPKAVNFVQLFDSTDAAKPSTVSVTNVHHPFTSIRYTAWSHTQFTNVAERNQTKRPTVTESSLTTPSSTSEIASRVSQTTSSLPIITAASQLYSSTRPASSLTSRVTSTDTLTATVTDVIKKVGKSTVTATSTNEAMYSTEPRHSTLAPSLTAGYLLDTVSSQISTTFITKKAITNSPEVTTGRMTLAQLNFLPIGFDHKNQLTIWPEILFHGL